MPADIDDYDDQTSGEITRSQLKRDAEELQTLGERLITLKTEDLDIFDLPERLRDAITLAKRITSHGALRRQRQYIGRLMRDVDVEPLRAELTRLENRQRNQTRQLHELETWRSRLINEESQAQEQLIKLLPNVDAQHLQQLVRQARKEKISGGSPKASRQLLRYLRDIFNAAELNE